MKAMKLNSRILKALLYLVMGAVFVLGFAPFGYWPLSLIAMAVLFNGWLSCNKVDTAIISFSFGLGQFLGGVSWIYVSMVNFGNLPPVLAVIAVVLVGIFLACYPLLAGLLFAWGKSPSLTVNALCIAPVCWILLEALRGFLFTGFPWLLLGYVSIDTWLVGFAPMGGVLLLSFILSALAGAIVLVWRSVMRKQFTQLIIPLGLSLVLVVGGFWLGHVKWVKPTGETLKLGLIQLNIPLDLKWQAGQQGEILDRYLAASSAVKDDADLIVWPEGALPLLHNQIPSSYLQHMDGLESKLLFGTLERRQLTDNTDTDLFNSMVLRDQNGEQFYRKQHLVPFGEFFPLKWLLSGLLAKLQVPMSNMTSWPGTQAHLNVNGIKLLPTICYEDAFPEDWRVGAESASALINISEDAWFGDSIAPHQRLEMGRFRAIETGREMIRVSNSGLSTVIRTDGSFKQISPQFEAVAMLDEVHGYTGTTPYVKWGRLPLFFLCFIVLVGRVSYFRYIKSSKYEERKKNH